MLIGKKYSRQFYELVFLYILTKTRTKNKHTFRILILILKNIRQKKRKNSRVCQQIQILGK